MIKNKKKRICKFQNKKDNIKKKKINNFTKINFFIYIFKHFFFSKVDKSFVKLGSEFQQFFDVDVRELKQKVGELLRVFLLENLRVKVSQYGRAKTGNVVDRYTNDLVPNLEEIRRRDSTRSEPRFEPRIKERIEMEIKTFYVHQNLAFSVLQELEAIRNLVVTSLIGFLLF